MLSAAVGSAIELDAALELRHAVPLSFAARSVGLAEAVRSGQRLLEVAAGLPRMRPQELVCRTEADLLVVGHPGSLMDAGHGLVALTALTCAGTPPCFWFLASRDPAGVMGWRRACASTGWCPADQLSC